MSLENNTDNPPGPIITIVLCTYNNATSLDITLKQISQCIIPLGYQVALLVIDNNSSDNTQNVITNRLAGYPFSCRSLFESRQGISYARNAALEQSTGTYILFTDDDATIPVNWISLYINNR